MSGEGVRGPGGLVVYEAGLDPARIDLSGGPADWANLPPMGLGEFVDERLDAEGAPRVCVIYDAPRRTDTRAAAALACARELVIRGRRVVVVDGDDQRPELSGWAGRLETEGWIDVVRYGVSPTAASVTLPWGPGEGRLMGVGSYAPVRAEAGEAAALVSRLHDSFRTVLICASTGDRGAHWAELDAVRVLCWDRGRADAAETALLARDAGALGASIGAAVAFGTAQSIESESPVVADEEAPKHSSPIFRRLAILMAVLVVVLGSWFLGQTVRRDTAPVELPPEDAITSGPAEDAADGGIVPAESGDVAAETTADADSIAAVAPVEIVETGTPPPESEPEPEPEPVSEPAALPGAIDWRAPVETGLFCLHVYSMADSAMAAEQLRFMDRRGVSGLVRRWRDVDEKVWYRVYAGSFASAADARAALPELYDLLNTEWAQVRRTARIR